MRRKFADLEHDTFHAPAGRHFRESRDAMERSIVAEQMVAMRIERAETAVEQSRSLIERILTDYDDEASGAT